MNNKKTIIVPFLTIFFLMVIAYCLTLVCDCAGISFLKWIASPILSLSSESGATTIAIIIFLLIISGISYVLEACGFLEYMVMKVAHQYANKRYLFIGIFTLFIFLMGSFVGSFEEVVPIVSLCVILAKKFGFDEYVGVSISLLAAGCGFATGVANPFTIGIAQKLADVPLFSGISLRLLSFVCIYLLLIGYIYFYTKKHAKDFKPQLNETFRIDTNKEKALKSFAIIMSISILITISSIFLTFLQDYTLIIMALAFLISGLLASYQVHDNNVKFIKVFLNGTKEVLPSIVLILMASSIKYTLETSGCMNEIIETIISLSGNLNKIEMVLFIYFICLVLELFVPSGSAKAFLLIPLLIPVAKEFGISSQLVILAYAYGDGFSNVFYPTNPALLVALGLIKMDYKNWFKYCWKFQFINLLLTSGILIFGLFIGY